METSMNHFTVIAFAAAVTLGLGSTAFAADAMDKDAVKAEKKRIEAQYKVEKAKCDSLSGNAKDVCEAEAKAKERIAKADLEVNAKDTPKARYDAQVTRAEAEYDVAKEKCDDLSGNQKDVCGKEAKAIEKKAKSDAHAAYKP
jgi:chromosome segregation ATPase